MQTGEFRLIPLGVAMQLPEGYEAHIVPRSSTYKNFGIIQTNHTGIVDNSYCGSNDWWYMPAYALRDTVIHKNDRICQFRIVENQPKIVFDEVAQLDGKDRGGSGKAITQLNQEIIITAKNIFPYPRCFFFLQNNIKFFSCQWK